ncbi:hypothetical protein JOB18_037852 [Solea senegalensis]|uniref:Uncharacterized protein n=1 Tax=Solea senegalensis TaxID=28829 RepID=A0AAV6RZG2_SOLSE|nr:hypothetical protein JOB18_037852 [Solea senegalensis]
MSRLKAYFPPTLDLFQFAYKANRSNEDAIFILFILHILQMSNLAHLDKTNTYVWMLFVESIRVTSPNSTI